MTVLFNHVAIIGIGLIGSSIARAIRKECLVNKISIASRSTNTLEKARVLNLGDYYSCDLASVVKDADLVILCTPLGTYRSIAKIIGKKIKKGAILTDVGSTKQCVHQNVTPFIQKGVHVIPGHPVAGTEKSGPENGFSELFQDRWCILTPDSEANKNAINSVATLWRKVGMMIEIMTAEHHDRILAFTSHLPHLVAYALVSTATNLENSWEKEVIKYSASGFRDFTRIAASDPIMWRDIFLENKSAVLMALDRFSNDLSIMKNSLTKNDGEKLSEIFTKTQGQKKKIVKARQDTPEEQKISTSN